MKQIHSSIYILRFDEDQVKVNNSVRIFELAKSDIRGNKETSFIGRGFILNLIADLISRSDKMPDTAKTGSTILQWIIISLCEREEVRQKLPINAEDQINICREFAEIIACGEEPTTEKLTEIIRCCKDTLTDKSIKSLIDLSAKEGSLKDHPLIRNHGGKWNFVNDQIYFNLIAEQIIDYAKVKSKRLIDIVDKIVDKGTFIDDIASAIFEQATIQDEMAFENIKILLQQLIIRSAKYETFEEIANKANKLATTLSLIAIDALSGTGETSAERTKKYISLLPDNEIANLYFIRTVSKLDLSNVKIHKCVFENVTFANCQFNDKTVFQKCIFVGGNIAYCKNFGLSKFLDIKTDQAADRIIKMCQTNDGAKFYDKDDLRHDMSEFIHKFTDKGTVKVKNVAESNFFTGVFGRSTKRNDIIKIMKKHLVEPHFLSRGPDTTYTIRNDAVDSFRHFLTNGVFTGQLAIAYEELKEKFHL